MKNKFLQEKLSNKKTLEIDITSLLDILVILLVFLLKAYNPDESVLHVVENLSLPFSDSKKIREVYITVQVDRKNQIWMDNEKIGVIEKKTNHGRIEILYESLVKEKGRFRKEQEEKFIREGLELDTKVIDDKLKKMNIVLDRDIPYVVLKNIMYTSTLTGIDQFKFIVMGSSDGV